MNSFNVRISLYLVNAYILQYVFGVNALIIAGTIHILIDTYNLTDYPLKNLIKMTPRFTVPMLTALPRGVYFNNINPNAPDQVLEMKLFIKLWEAHCVHYVIAFRTIALVGFYAPMIWYKTFNKDVLIAQLVFFILLTLVADFVFKLKERAAFDKLKEESSDTFNEALRRLAARRFSFADVIGGRGLSVNYRNWYTQFAKES